MTPQESKKYCLDQLLRSRDDSLERAQHAFRRMTPEQMKEQHGESGLTRQEILDGYREQRMRHDAATEWLRGVKP